MATEKLVDAIVRGPMPYFGKDGVLYVPGQVVRNVSADDVSEDRSRKVSVEVEARNGELRQRKVDRPVPFAPIDSDTPTVEAEVTAATVATGQPDRLNVTDFLKESDDHIIAAIVGGSVDDFLGAIDQAIVAGKKGARHGVKEAVAARLAALHRA